VQEDSELNRQIHLSIAIGLLMAQSPWLRESSPPRKLQTPGILRLPILTVSFAGDVSIKITNPRNHILFHEGRAICVD
jgi:hypothetical protein